MWSLDQSLGGSTGKKQVQQPRGLVQLPVNCSQYLDTPVGGGSKAVPGAQGQFCKELVLPHVHEPRAVCRLPKYRVKSLE